ncbi:hypothetical protein Tco_0640498 [Tanacetum coccineum]
MKRKLEEMESRNHDNIPMVMKIVKRYCEEKRKNERLPRKPRCSRLSDHDQRMLWRKIYKSEAATAAATTTT